MSNRFDLLTQQLFQKNIDECTVEEMQNLARQFPYFAPAQYILTKKLQQEKSAEFSAQFQKAILYYPNPVAFDQFINEEHYVVDFELPHNDAGAFSETVGEPVTVVETEPEIELAEPVENEVQPTEEAVGKTTIEEVKVDGQALPITEEQVNGEADLPAQAIAEDRGEEPALQIAPIVLSETPADTGTGMAFEPFHTVDYFASQGIKLSQEEATKDRFGRQLKSFTEWLKTMKKLPVTEQAKSMDTVSEQKVENLAAHSVEQSEIVTETMAEVWVKQGNTEKAREIYNKLGLIYPDKRTYFAAKVDSLK